MNLHKLFYTAGFATGGKLKIRIKSLIIQMVKIKGKYNELVGRAKRLDAEVGQLTSQVEKGKEKSEKYNLVEKILGKDKIDEMLQNYEKEQMQEIHTRKISTKIKRNER